MKRHTNTPIPETVPIPYSQHAKPGKQPPTSGRVRDKTRASKGKPQQIDVKKYVNPLESEKRVMLKNVVKRLMRPGKGILMVDETIEQLGTNLENHDVPNTHQNRMRYVISMLGDVDIWRPYVSGVVFRKSVYDCLRHKDFRKFALSQLENKSVFIGIRMDKDKVELPGTNEELTPSELENLAKDCEGLKAMGVSFVVLACVFKMSDYTPSLLAYVANTTAVARCAATCQRAGLVPIVSLQVLDSDRSPETSPDTEHPTWDVMEHRFVTEEILAFLVKSLSDYYVYLEGALLRLSPVAHSTVETETAAKATLKVIMNRIPPALGGVLLSDQDTLSQSTETLNKMVLTLCPKPCFLTFAWGHVIRHGLLDVWRGQDEKKNEVSKAICKRLKTCSEATMGQLPKNQHSLFITKVPSSEALAMKGEFCQ